MVKYIGNGELEKKNWKVNKKDWNIQVELEVIETTRAWEQWK